MIIVSIADIVIIIITIFTVPSVLGTENVYRDFYSRISRSNGISNSFLMNSIWNARFNMKDLNEFSNEQSTSDACFKDLDLFQESFLEGEIWALKMLDATSHLQSGFLEGNIINLGNFKECLAINEQQQHNIKRQQYHIKKQQHRRHREQNYIKGQYCVVTFYTSPSSFAQFVTNHYNIQSAICLPSSCSVENITHLLKNGLEELGRNIYFSVDDCETERSLMPRIGAIEVVILFFLGILVSMLLISTVTDIFVNSGLGKYKFNPKNSKGYNAKLEGIHRILLMFSLKLNLNRLLKEDKRKDSIGCLHGLRFISACMILSIHRIITDPQPLTNLFMLDNEVRKWNRLIQMNAYLFVDVFFVISGLLVAYNFTKTRKLNGFQLFIHRYLRLTPPLLACILLTILLDMLCDGPYCNSINRLAKEQCLNNSVFNLLFISNLINSSESCLPHTWYLAADMQLYCISFLILIFARKVPQHIYKLLGCYWLLSVTTTFAVSYAYQINAGFIGTANSYEIDSLLLYEQFYTRAGPWIIGFALGLWLRNPGLLQLGKVAVTIGWTLAIFCLSIAYFGVHPFVQYGFQHGGTLDSIYNTFSHSTFALGIGWIIFSCHQGYGGFLNSFLSSVPFERLSKLTYCFYLVHPLAQAMQYSQVVSSRTYNDHLQISLLLGDVMYSTIFAAILYLTVEVPFTNLDRGIWKKLDQNSASRKLNQA